MTEPKKSDIPVRDRLILAGITEINHSGVQRFSVRRVADACGLSCAAPYKHFQDKQGFLTAIVAYVIDQWYSRQQEVLQGDLPTVREQLVAVSVAHIRFLVENPHFLSIIMLKDATYDVSFTKMRSELSARSKELIATYCKSVHMPPEVERFKTYVVRSLIYGAALMFDNGELPYNEKTLALAGVAINREFDLP